MADETQADNQQHSSGEGDAAKDGDVVQGDKNIVQGGEPAEPQEGDAAPA